MVKAISVYILIIFTLLPIQIIQAQSMIQTSKDELLADFIFFNDHSLLEILEKIIQDKNECNNSTIYSWYVEFNSSKKIVVTKGYIGNLIATPLDNDRKQIFATTIGNIIVFILMKEEDASISKTGFSIDLCEYVDDYDFSFTHFSAWLIMRNDLKFELADSLIIKCN